jgi:hypothetical protein
VESAIRYILDFPLLVFVIVFVAQWLAARLGDYVRKSQRALPEVERKDLDLVLTATLTLLALIIGFSFSMAISRYDLRKTNEEAEANAIGTEYFRADLLPDKEAARVHELLRTYVRQRVSFFITSKRAELRHLDISTAQLQKELWSAVQSAATAQPTPISALVVTGMNDVLNSEGYTTAAWSNRIPLAAWALLVAIAICANLLLGYVSHRSSALLVLVLPLVTSIALFLIAEIDSPRGGVIRVLPQNLMRIAHSMNLKN